MIDELEVKGLELSLSDGDSDGHEIKDTAFQEELILIFKGLGVLMPKYAISIIQEFCKPGITLVFTSDGGEFAVNTKACKLSKFLTIQSELNPHRVHVNNISEATFSLICSYLNHHNGVEPMEIAKPIRSVAMSRIVEDEWDAVFADSMSKRQTFQVILAANKIDCSSLLHLLCAKVATLIKGKNPEEIKRILSEEDETYLSNQLGQSQRERLTLEDAETSIDDINLEPLTLEDTEAPQGDDANLGSESKEQT